VGSARDPMDASRYFVRPFTDRDYEASSRIDALVNPELTFTAKEQRHWEQQFATPGLVDEKWVVEERPTRTVVGMASMSHSPYMFHPHKFWTYVVVDPAHRGRGIGRALASLLESEAASHQAMCFWANVRKDDSRSLEFSRKLGFVELRRLWMSTLDLARNDLPALPDRTTSLERQGIRFTTLSAEGPERPEVRRELFDLLSDASRDVPRMGEYTPITFEQFVGEFGGPSFLPDGLFLAVDGTTYAAMSNFERSFTEKDSLRVGFTGTRAAYRGRGIASELKRRALEYARGKGIRYLRTMNDSLNVPMWAINQKQGFRRTVEWISQERRLAPDIGPSTTPSSA
jgi:RimJ/RimL family protein N-acetyltransferase